MEGFRGDAVYKKVGDIQQLVFPGSLTLGDVQSCIGLAGAHREKLFFGICDDKITISLNKATLLETVDEDDVRPGKKRRRREDPLEQKIERSMAALEEKIGDGANVDKTRELLKALCALKDVSSGAPSVGNFNVFLKGESRVLFRLAFKRGARASMSTLARALGDCTDGALTKADETEKDCEPFMSLMVNVSTAAPRTAADAAAAPAPPASPAP
jgi:hypothetical protein